jgi:hypothetical protein
VCNLPLKFFKLPQFIPPVRYVRNVHFNVHWQTLFTVPIENFADQFLNLFDIDWKLFDDNNHKNIVLWTVINKIFVNNESVKRTLVIFPKELAWSFNDLLTNVFKLLLDNLFLTLVLLEGSVLFGRRAGWLLVTLRWDPGFGDFVAMMIRNLSVLWKNSPVGLNCDIRSIRTYHDGLDINPGGHYRKIWVQILHLDITFLLARIIKVGYSKKLSANFIITHFPLL